MVGVIFLLKSSQMREIQRQRLVDEERSMNELSEKDKDRWDIMTNWGYGWECENSEYTRTDAKRSLKEYRENLAGRADVRMEKHREPITA